MTIHAPSNDIARGVRATSIDRGGLASHAEQRTDIEGLRAIAVALVVVYHFFPGALPGGYVGVDVFFVISGYLITRSLLHTLNKGQSGRAWLADFWARRMRRLLPNALLVMFAVGVAGIVLFSAFSLRRLGSDISWSALYAANWLFVLRSVDYLMWDESQRSVLLHFWSLAVEEQFYFVWPVMLLFMTRQGSTRKRVVIAALGISSLVYCLALATQNLTVAFFSTPARAWELLIGAWLACGDSPVPARWREMARAAGLLMIATAGIVFTDDSQHPGLATILPVMGCLLAIAAGPPPSDKSALSRGLSLPLVQALGARSYSIYLWHWPVVQFGGLWGLYPSAATRVLMIGLALILAELAYRGVERPARFQWGLRWTASRVLMIGLLAGVALTVFGFMLRATSANDMREVFGMRPPARADLPSLESVRADLPAVYRDGCHLPLDVGVSPPCSYGAAHGSETVVLFGDSHAAQWFSALDAVASTQGFVLHSWTKSNCPSIDAPMWSAVARSRDTQCDQWREDTLTRIVALRPRWVVLSNLVEGSPSIFDPPSGRPIRGQRAAKAWSTGLERVIARLRAAEIGVIVIRDVPRPRPDLLDCLYSASDSKRCELGLTEALSTPAIDIDAAHRGGAVIWDLSTEICPGDRCPVVREDVQQIVYRDANHLTDSEVRRLVPAISAHWTRTMGSGVARPGAR